MVRFSRAIISIVLFSCLLLFVSCTGSGNAPGSPPTSGPSIDADVIQGNKGITYFRKDGIDKIRAIRLNTAIGDATRLEITGSVIRVSSHLPLSDLTFSSDKMLVSVRGENQFYEKFNATPERVASQDAVIPDSSLETYCQAIPIGENNVIGQTIYRELFVYKSGESYQLVKGSAQGSQSDPRALIRTETTNEILFSIGADPIVSVVLRIDKSSPNSFDRAYFASQWDTITNIVCHLNMPTPGGGQPAADNTPPTPGTGLSFSNITETDLTVSWGAASDNTTPATALRYKLVMSIDSATIDTIDEIELLPSAAIQLDWSANTLSKSITGLSAGTKYYFAVLVKDSAGNKNIYAVSSAGSSDATPPTTGAAITFTNVTETTLTVDWGGATDDVTVPEELLYKLVKSTDSADIDTISEADAITGANLLSNWTDAFFTQDVAELLPGTAYYFGVLVKDVAGNINLYAVSGTSTTGIWIHEAYLKAPNVGAGDYFGVSVAVSGDWVVIGAHLEDSNQTTVTNGVTANSDDSLVDSGAVYIFKRTGASWIQSAYIKAPNAGGTDHFGGRVAISGNTAVVGTGHEDSGQTFITNGDTASNLNGAADAGAAYVFTFNGTMWAQEAYLKANNAQAGDIFGSVAIDGDTIVVGAMWEDSSQITVTNGGGVPILNNSATDSGAAYVFNRTAGAWAQEAYLKAPNPDVSDQFGMSVGISGDTIVVGANLEDSSQSFITNGLGASSNDTVIDSGAAYVFKRTAAAWAQEAYLKPSNRDAGDFFGYSVAIDGDTVVVGAYEEDSNQMSITNGTGASTDNNATRAGAAYVFKRTGANWVQQAYLKAPNAQGGDGFGINVAIAGNLIVVGAYLEDSNQTTINNDQTASTDESRDNSGAAYVFKRTGANWVQQAYLKVPNADSGDLFGTCVAISSSTIVVGAWREDSSQNSVTNGATASSDNGLIDSGAAYIFHR